MSELKEPIGYISKNLLDRLTTTETFGMIYSVEMGTPEGGDCDSVIPVYDAASDQQKAELKELIHSYGMKTIDRYLGIASDESEDEIISRINRLIDQM